MPSEYTVTVYDIGFYYWLKDKVFEGDLDFVYKKTDEVIEKVVKETIPDEIKDYDYVVTTSDLDFIDRL